MSILATILAAKVGEVAAAKAKMPLSDLEGQISQLAPVVCMASALRRSATQPIRIISEFKRASPSAGAIAAQADPEPYARAYESAGASVISVLTDEKFFDGSLGFIPRVKKVVSIPVLRKDFLIDPYQITEARAAGADAVLLIASALPGSRLRDMYQCVRDHGMRALVEVHDEQEAERAALCGAEIIGVNHRNLATFEVDLGLTGRLAGLLGTGCILVGESGIKTPAHVSQLLADGAHAILVGESLMRADDIATELRSFLEAR